MRTKTTRRSFLATLGGVSVGILAACQQAPAPASKPAESAAAAKPTTAAAIVPPTAAPAAPAQKAPAGPTTAPAAQKPAAQAAPTAAPTTAPAAAPTAAPTAASSAIKRGGELRMVQINDFVSMDPIHASGPTARACYDTLFAWRPNDKGVFGVKPMLAKSWDLGNDKLVVKLRENVKFHDGSDLNADAVVWNIARMVQNPKSFARITLPQIDKDKPAQALDPLTVQINLTRPSAAILSALSDGASNMNAAIVSKKAADDKGEEWLKLNPIGTGPFKFVSFQSGDKLVVEKNPTYWEMGADGKPLPYVDRATYRVIIEASTQFTEMRAGTADLIENVRGRDVPAAKQIQHATYIEAPLRGNKRQYFFNSLKPPFKDNLKLRQAVHHAVDRDALIKALDAGLGIPLPYEFVPGSIGYDSTVPYYEFNPDKSKQLLSEAGVTLPLEVRLTAHNREVDQQQAQLLQAMLDKVGIKVNLDIVERVAWGEKVRIQNDFEMATRQSGVAIDPSQDLLVTWAEGGNSAYHRAHVDGLIETLQKADSEYDDAKRQDLFVQAQKLMHESAWFGYMWFEPGNFLVHKRIQGFPPAIWGSLAEAEWWIKE
ncbi:MAG: ABC transporter substrate-binding protein [Chloroflexi bacterium]|nr:ABC transporter substrate-binding protein [Chloroflexota bacterium]